MKRIYFIETADGERRLDQDDFPLSIGGPGSDITLQDVSAKNVLAHIALSSGHAYIQPDSDTVELFHNHEHITSSTWLKSGDRVQLGEQVLCWDVKGDQVFVKVRLITDEAGLQPPSDPPPESEADQDLEVIPTPVASNSTSNRRSLRHLLITVFSLLALTALFVLFATPVAINISPEPEARSISGFPPPVSLGQKMLVVPGSYTLHASREGYQQLEQDFEVTSGGFQSLNFELQELPGRLRISVAPAVPFRVVVGGIETLVGTDGVLPLERGTRQLSIETDRYFPIGRGGLSG